MRDTLLIATAGHVDHGKSTLVRLLTGTDPDRWQEEKDRGITIDLGYAYHSSNDRDYSFVDVPGHERFIHNMLAGIGSIDAVLLVIAADESIMPQTREHALALSFLGVFQIGIIVTKCDLVDEDFLNLVHAELDDWLPAFGWENAPRANVASTNPESLNWVLEILNSFEAKSTVSASLFRMPIDRVFVSQGSGTVVTGSVDLGVIDKSDKLVLMPQNQTSRIRQIQVHGNQVAQAGSHQRAALNLADFHHSEIHRGNFLFKPPGALLTRHLLVQLTPFHEWKPSVKHAFHLHHFSAHLMAKMLWQENGLAMFTLNQPHIFWAQDKGLIRDDHPLQIVAGFQVRHPCPVTTRKKYYRHWLENSPNIKTQAEWQHWFLTHTDVVMANAEMIQLCGAPLAETVSRDMIHFDSGQFINAQQYRDQAKRCLSILDYCHESRPYYTYLPLDWVRSCWLEAKIEPVIAERAITQWTKAEQMQVFADRIKRNSHLPSWNDQRKGLLNRLLSFRDNHLPLIDLREYSHDRPDYETITSMLIWEKYLVSLTADLLLPSEFLNKIMPLLAAEFYESSLQVGDLKSKLGLTRRVAIPLLELFDKMGLTVRQQEGRRWLQRHPEPILSRWEKPF